MGSKSVTVIDMTGQPEVQEPKRHFPPLYKSSGDTSSDRLAFFHILEHLKVSTSCFVLSGWSAPPLYVTDTKTDRMGR